MVIQSASASTVTIIGLITASPPGSACFCRLFHVSRRSFCGVSMSDTLLFQALHTREQLSSRLAKSEVLSFSRMSGRRSNSASGPSTAIVTPSDA